MKSRIVWRMVFLIISYEPVQTMPKHTLLRNLFRFYDALILGISSVELYWTVHSFQENVKQHSSSKFSDADIIVYCVVFICWSFDLINGNLDYWSYGCISQSTMNGYSDPILGQYNFRSMQYSRFGPKKFIETGAKLYDLMLNRLCTLIIIVSHLMSVRYRQ